MGALSTTCKLLLCMAICAHAVAPAAAQDSPPPQQPVTTLRVTSRTVAISAVVRTKAGQPKGGLSKDDFVLKQDGKEEPIRYFAQGSQLPLTFALMVDTSTSQRTFLGDEALASDVFFETMLGASQDRAMLVEFGKNVRVLNGMTNSPDALHLALTGLSPHASTVGGTLLYDAIYAVAKNSLASETGRKAMVILTDGDDHGSQRSLSEAAEQAQRADVQIYAILYSALPGSTTNGPAGNTRTDPGRAALQQLSEDTGGQVFTVAPTLGLREIFARIAEDLRLEYELGYTPPETTQPNTYHKLELKARDGRLRVQARKGFFAHP